jgi:hypothetical protein
MTKTQFTMTQPLEISLQECRENWLREFLSETFASLEAQGFTLEEILDCMSNYAYFNTNSIDVVFLIAKASLLLKEGA